MQILINDLRHATRRLLGSPGFTALAVLTVGLGVGATTVMFSAVHGVLLKPLSYPEPDRLVMIRGATMAQPGRPGVISYPDYRDWRRESRSFETIAALRPADVTLAGPGGPERIEGARVTASFFQALRVVPELGQSFPEESDKPGGERVAVLGHRLWRRLGGDPTLVGRTVTLSGQPHAIIGILPAGFRPPREVERAEVFAPLAMDGEELEQRGNRSLVAIGRLRSGVSVAQARAELAAVARHLEKEYPDSNTGVGAMVESLHADTVGELRRPLLVLLGAVAFVLLIACTNMANLVLPRALARRREMAVRAALGARRSRLVRQLLTESLLLGVVGGVAGLALAYWGLDALVSLAPAGTPRLRDIALDGRVLAFSLAVSLATGVAFGLAPALSASRTDVQAALHESGRSPALARHPGARLLVVAEIALSLVLMAGAGLLLESFRRLLSVDPGFDPHNVLTLGVSLPATRYPRPDQRARFFAELLERVRIAPGVVSAAAVTELPLGGDASIATRFTVEGRPAPAPGQKPRAEYHAVTAGYFETMRIPLKKGRTFDAGDRREAPAVAVVNEALAAQVFPGQDPLGQRLRIGIGTDESDPRTFEVVGVVGDVRHVGRQVFALPEIYVPHPQQSWSWMSLVVRTSGDPLALAGALRRAVAAIDSQQAVYDVRPLRELLSDSLAARSFIMALLGGFALLGLALATVGVYGVLAESVERRRGEIGLRLAVGASPGDVLRMVLGQAARLAAAGVTLGLAAAFALTRVMQSLLFGVSATDPATFATVAGVLAIAALLASYLPARRAAGLDPATVLREE
jgi:putative ABC transport system permease protein